MIFLTADDFGLDSENNRGIIVGIEEGWLKSVSVIVNRRASQSALQYLQRQKNRILLVGLHFNLTEGKPLTKCPSLVDSRGSFYPLGRLLWRLFWKKINLAEVSQELEAQYQKLRQVGIPIIHLNSHQHIHFWPPLFKLFVGFAKRKGIVWVRQGNWQLWWLGPPRLAKWTTALLSWWNSRGRLPRIIFWDFRWSGGLRNLLKLNQKSPKRYLEIGLHLAQKAKRFPEREKELQFWRRVLKITQ